MKKILRVKVIPRAKRVQVIENKTPGFDLTLYITVPPVDGKANRAVILILAEHFHVSPSRVSLLSGHNSRSKILGLDYSQQIHNAYKLRVPIRAHLKAGKNWEEMESIEI